MQVTDKNGNIFGPHGLQVNGSDGKPKTTGGGGGSASWGGITGTLSAQTDLQTALNGKEPSITAGTASQYYRGDKTFQTLDKTAVGLGNVDNTSDANKPVSTATSTALNNKQDTLVSGTNIKTVNGNSLLGSGNVTTNPRTIASVNGSGIMGLTNSTSASILIPAGTLTTDNTLYISAFINRTVVSGAGSTTFRFYVNTTNNLATATLLGSAANMATTVRFQRFERNIFFDGNSLNLFLTSTSASNDLTASGISLIGFNPAVNNYLLFTVQHSTSSSDVAAWKRIIIQAYD